jgi:hypothetical protein
MKKFGYLAMAFLVVGLASCSKDGDTGPAGAVGAAGAAGPAGSVGPAGADGAVGTANVIYSPKFTIAEADWTVSISGRFQFADVAVPMLTQEILDTGVVLVYRFSKTGGGDDEYIYNPLPYFGVGRHTFTVSLNNIRFGIFDETAPFLQPQDEDYRYVLIPGAVSTSGKTSPQQAIYNQLQAAGVDINNFAQVAAYYNIQ